MDIAQFEQQIVQPRVGRTLLVGSKHYPDSRRDRCAVMFPEALGLDMQSGDGVDIVHDLEQPLPPEYGKFDHIECLSVLEHVRKPWLLVPNMEAALVLGGTIYVRAPFVWRVHGYPNDYFRYTIEGLKSLFSLIHWEAGMFFAETEVIKKKVPSTEIKGHKYFARTEVALFGRRI